MTIQELVLAAFKNSSQHGFWNTRVDPNPSFVPEKLCLIHSEISEALEWYRSGNATYPLNEVNNTSPKPDGFAIELADAVIRIADLCGALNIDLEKVIQEKMKYNESRPYKHGKLL